MKKQEYDGTDWELDFARDKILEMKDVLSSWCTARDDAKSSALRTVIDNNLAVAYELILQLTAYLSAYGDFVVSICQKITMGDAIFTQNLNDSYSIVEEYISKCGRDAFITQHIENDMVALRVYSFVKNLNFIFLDIYATIYACSVRLCASIIIAGDDNYLDVLKSSAGFLMEKIPVIGDVLSLAELFNLFNRELQRQEKLSATDDLLSNLEEKNAQLHICLAVTKILTNQFTQVVAKTEKKINSSLET